MPIDVTCPKCGSGLSVPDEFAGKSIRCGGCEEIINVTGILPPPLPGAVPPPLPGTEIPPPLPTPVAKPVTAIAVARATPIKVGQPELIDEEPKSSPIVPSENPFRGQNERHEPAKPKIKTAMFILAGFVLFSCCGLSVVVYAFVHLTKQVADMGGKTTFPPPEVIESQPAPPKQISTQKLPTPSTSLLPATKRNQELQSKIETVIPKAPSPVGMPGLKLYVSFSNDPIREDLSRTKLPVVGVPFFNDGPNRKASRFIATPNREEDSVKFACDLSFFVDQLTVKDDAPFTYSLWIKNSGPSGTAFAATQSTLELSPRIEIKTSLEGVHVECYCDENDSDKKFIRTKLKKRGQITNTFQHIVFKRTLDGKMQVYVYAELINDAPAKSLPEKQTGGMKFQFAGFALRPFNQSYPIEMDEFCFFDRELSLVEIKKLAGQESK